VRSALPARDGRVSSSDRPGFAHLPIGKGVSVPADISDGATERASCARSFYVSDLTRVNRCDDGRSLPSRE
jgi:hypothetical protein